jgi:outer membrane protein TolC
VNFRKLGAVPLLLLLCACKAPRVERSAEAARFNTETAARLASAAVDPAKPLTLARSEEIALQHNLDYRVRLLRAQLQDEEVRRALVTQLPQINAQFGTSKRSNAPLVKGFGGGTFQFEDQQLDRFNIRAMIPLFDFGATYFAYHIAKDRRLQERLAAVRARELLLRDVRTAYATHAAAIRQEKLVQVALEAAGEVMKVAKSQEREGLTSAADTAFIEAQLAQAALEVLMARRRVEETRFHLNQTLSLMPWTTYQIESALPPLKPLLKPEEIEALEQTALRTRPELWAQDLEQQIAANEVRKRVTAFFPKLDGAVEWNWSTLSTVVNPAYAVFGLAVSQTLLDGTSSIWRYRSAKKDVAVEKERALLVAMGVLFDVDFRILRMLSAHDRMTALAKVVEAQEVLFKTVTSRYREGMETGANVARALAELRIAQRDLDQAQSDYQVAWFEVEAAVLSQESTPAGDAAEQLDTKPADLAAPSDDEKDGD